MSLVLHASRRLFVNHIVNTTSHPHPNMSSASSEPEQSTPPLDPPSQPPPHNLDGSTAPPTDPESNAPTQPRRLPAWLPGFTASPQPPYWAFLLRNALDIATQLCCLTTSILLYVFCPPILPRYFRLYPGIENSEWGLRHGQPHLKEYVNTIESAVYSFAVPVAVMGAMGLWGSRAFGDSNAAVRLLFLCTFLSFKIAADSDILLDYGSRLRTQSTLR